jgi:RimJ/RimL family protein N-acetyltransferase
MRVRPATPEDAEVHKIELEVWPDNEAAIVFYERAGFQREGLRRDHYRPPRRSPALRRDHGAPLPRRHPSSQ